MRWQLVDLRGHAALQRTLRSNSPLSPATDEAEELAEALVAGSLLESGRALE